MMWKSSRAISELLSPIALESRICIWSHEPMENAEESGAMEKEELHITREKHLDHLVKVTPLIVLGYALQCYILMNMNGALGSMPLMILGLALVALIGCFVLYDLKHQVKLDQNNLEISFYFYHKTIPLKEIHRIHVSESTHTFGILMLETPNQGKIRLYFIDDAHKIKQWIETKQNSLPLAA
jgi:hypothetical protein